MMLGKMGWKATLKTSFCFRSLDAPQSGDGENASFSFQTTCFSAFYLQTRHCVRSKNILYQISILLASRKKKLDLLYFSFTSSVFSQADTFSNQILLALQSCLPLSSAFSNLRQSAAKFWHASPNTCEDPLLFCYLVFLLSSLPSKVGKQTNLRRNAETQLRGRPGIPETWEASNCKLHPILNLLSWTPLWKKIQRESLSKLYQISFFSWWWGSWIRGTFFRV